MSIRSLAWLNERRQLNVIDADGHSGPQLTNLPWAPWSGPPEDEVHSWPTWSPDGRRVASFRMVPRGSSGITCRVQITEQGGAEVVEVAEIDDRLPIYLQWMPDGDRLAVLTQAGEQLLLDRVDTHTTAPAEPLLKASPLFFQHTPDGRLVVFAGEEGEVPRISVYRGSQRTDLPGLPGNFCAPVVMGEDVGYVVVDHDKPRLAFAGLDGTNYREVLDAPGLAALLPSPDGRTLAWSVAHDGTGDTYRGIELLDVSTGERRVLTETGLVAFHWLPNGSGLVTAARTRAGTMKWALQPVDGPAVPLAELFPTRDLRFYLRFFEQFAPSHPLIDPTSQTLVLPGGLLGQPDPRGTPRLWAISLQGDPPREIGEGVFATFASATETAWD